MGLGFDRMLAKSDDCRLSIITKIITKRLHAFILCSVVKLSLILAPLYLLRFNILTIKTQSE